MIYKDGEEIPFKLKNLKFKKKGNKLIFKFSIDRWTEIVVGQKKDYFGI